jgi:hypothetical protein
MWWLLRTVSSTMPLWPTRSMAASIASRTTRWP